MAKKGKSRVNKNDINLHSGFLERCIDIIGTVASIWNVVVSNEVNLQEAKVPKIIIDRCCAFPGSGDVAKLMILMTMTDI